MFLAVLVLKAVTDYTDTHTLRGHYMCTYYMGMVSKSFTSSITKRTDRHMWDFGSSFPLLFLHNLSFHIQFKTIRRLWLIK